MPTATSCPQATSALRAVYGRRIGTGAGSYEQDIVVISPREAKGLEFDGVVVLEPSVMLNHEHGRVGDLYVAMTRPTQRLRLIAARGHSGGHRALRLSGAFRAPVAVSDDGRPVPAPMRATGAGMRAAPGRRSC